MLIVFPLGLWIFAFVCYVIYLLSEVPVWRVVSLYAMGGGIVGAALAAVPGVIDFLSLGQSRVQNIALSHMISNIVGLKIFIIPFALAVFSPDRIFVPLVLGIFGLLAIGVGGWLGGTLVYEHGVGVECRQTEEVVTQHV